jgi:steroid delta-isomerase-like uncharacterized protein
VSTEPDRLAVDALAADWADAWTGSGFEGCCTADVSYEDPLAPEPLRGPEALADHAERLRVAFPDARIEHTSPALQRGGHACLPWRLLGTNRGELAVLPATGRFLALHGVHYVELSEEGRVRRARGFFDLYDAASQLGVLPAPGGLGEAAMMMVRGFGLVRRSPGG